MLLFLTRPLCCGQTAVIWTIFSMNHCPFSRLRHPLLQIVLSLAPRSLSKYCTMRRFFWHLDFVPFSIFDFRSIFAFLLLSTAPALVWDYWELQRVMWVIPISPQEGASQWPFSGIISQALVYFSKQGTLLFWTEVWNWFCYSILQIC